ncbi:MAG: peptidase S8 [Bacteroidetes bacterium]|nr:MAG: peptidase S8 [Bacteroidota bacterium]
MKKLSLTLLMSLFVVSLFAQTTYKFWVSLTDKNSSPYSITQPLDFLSQRAIDRRTTQNITITSQDFPVNPSYKTDVRSTGVTIIGTSKWMNGILVQTTDSSKAADIAALTCVDEVLWVATYSGTKSFFGGGNAMKKMNIEDEVAYIQEINKANGIDYGFGYNQANMLAVDFLHDIGSKGGSKVIAVLDGGFRDVDNLAAFDSLFDAGRILGTFDVSEPGNNVYNEATHGMSVLSCMGSNLPGKMVGTAPHASYWLFRTEETGTEQIVEEYNWLIGAEMADSVGADMINSSLGYTEYDYPIWNHTYADMDGNTTIVTKAADLASSKGILVCNSAGNSGNDPWNYIGAPADADSVLAVGGTDKNGIHTYFSSHGYSYDGRVKPNVVAQAENTIVANTSGSFGPSNGTSFSSPVTCGAVCCLWDANPDMTNMEIIDAVERSADRYNNPDTLYGYGIPNLAAANIILSGGKLHDFDKDDDIDILPNPFTDKIHIIFNSTDTESLKIELLNMQGSLLVYMDNLQRITGYNYYAIPHLDKLATGMYVIKVTSGSKVFTKKMMKAK